MSSSQKNGQIENEFDCSMSNVVAFELYNYFDLKMNGFSKSGIFSKMCLGCPTRSMSQNILKMI